MWDYEQLDNLKCPLRYYEGTNNDFFILCVNDILESIGTLFIQQVIA